MMNRKGFSLIELLVVMGIIAVLAALVTYNFNAARARARDLQRKNDVKTLQQALELYKNDNSQTYPVTDFTGLMTTLTNQGYLQKTLSDPKESLKTGSWQQYTYSAFGLTYQIRVCLENRSDEDADRNPAVTNCAANAGVIKTVIQP